MPIVLGVLTATLINHAGAGAVGTLPSQVLSPAVLNWAVVASFVLMAGWILMPDKLDASDVATTKKSMGVYSTTVLALFLAEMGDKTQVATVALAARFHEFFAVVSGTTLGMMLANVPVIYFGHRFADRLPAKTVHVIACLIFVVLGGLVLRNALIGAAV